MNVMFLLNQQKEDQSIAEIAIRSTGSQDSVAAEIEAVAEAAAAEEEGSKKNFLFIFSFFLKFFNNIY